MIDVKRLAHVTLTTPDVARQVEYYQSIVGLACIEQSRDRAVLATRLGVEAVVLERGDVAGLGRLGFQIAPETDLDTVGRELSARQIPFETRSGITPGVAQAVVFEDAFGTPVEIFSDYVFAKVERKHVGIMPIKLGHVARFVPDRAAIERFYTGLLGFRVSDWRTTVSVFMRCGPDHHTINVFETEPYGLAHFAFEVKDFAELQRACDVLVANDLLLEWGPSRHVIGHNISCYHRNRDGLRVEFYCEMDQMKDEALGYFEPRPWHEDMPQRPKVWPIDTSRNYWSTLGA
jgi:catechol 2,3-dioxygenase-like lactoylglutathione lyase family enzyme